MAVLRWPYQLADVNLSGGNIRERGKIFHGNFNLLPEYHDGASDYFQDAFATADGWASMGADTVVSVASGELVFTAGASPTTFVRANKAQAASSRSVRIKWRCTQADLTTLEYRTSGGGTTVSKSIAGQTSGIEDIMCGASFTDIEIRFNSTGNMIASTPVRIDFIQVYNPAIPYSSLALDASGNGNHGTVFGATPTADGGLSFDGVNDYVELANTIPPTGDFTLHLDVNMITNPTTEGVIFDSRPSSFASGGAGVLIGLNTSGVLRTAIGIGATNVNIISGNPTIGGAGRQIISVVFNRTSSLMLTYNNGILVNTTSIATVIGSIFANTIMRYFRPGYTTSSPTFAQGTIRQPRIYNRTLTAEEVRILSLTTNIYNPLSRYPLQDGFSEMPQDGVLRSQTDIGPSKTRQRFTALATYFTAEYDVDFNQRQVLDHFYRSVTRGGSLAFEYPHPDGYNVDARFAAPPQFTPNNQEYVATVALEVLP